MSGALDERKLLLARLPSFPDLVLKLGKDIGEPYCLQFGDRGYDQNYHFFNREEAIPKVAERVTDDQLVAFLAKPEVTKEAGRVLFRGKHYMLRGGELKLESEWVSIKADLLRLTRKHGGTFAAVLEACYKVSVEREERWNNWLKIQSVAKDLGASSGWRNALTDLELEEIVERHKGDIQIPPELAPLVREFLDESKDEIEWVEEGEEQEEPVEIPEDLFDVVVGHDEVKKLFFMSLQAVRPVHILLVGPPGTAKSVFLMVLKKHLPGSRYALGSTSSKAGIVDFIIEHRPRYLLIDELDKMDMKDYSALLSLMEPGVVTRLKKGMTEEVKVKTWVFAAVNRDDSLPRELKSRFLIRYLPEYSEDDYKKVVRAVLIKWEAVDESIAPTIAEKVAKHSRDVRDGIKVARLYGKGQHMSVDDLIGLVFAYESVE